MARLANNALPFRSALLRAAAVRWCFAAVALFAVAMWSAHPFLHAHGDAGDGHAEHAGHGHDHGPDAPASPDHPDCPLCQVSGGHAPVPEAAAVLAPAATEIAAGVLGDDLARPSSPFLRAAPPRGPPVA